VSFSLKAARPAPLSAAGLDAELSERPTYGHVGLDMRRHDPLGRLKVTSSDRSSHDG
jgi:hypothetical protein